MLTYKGIIFDFFGVFCTDTANNWFEGQPGHETKLAQFDNYCKMSDFGDISTSQFYELVGELLNIAPDIVKNGIETGSSINWKFIEYIRAIKPRYRTIILSNASNDTEMNLIDDNNFRDIFDNVLLSSNIGMIKPNPEAFEYALEMIGLAADEVITIDDRQSNIDAAEKCGIKGVLFDNTSRVISSMKELGVS